MKELVEVIAKALVDHPDSVSVTEKEEGKERAEYFKDTVKPAMDELRSPVDKLEMLVDKDLWPMPSYGDLIFEV